MFEGSLVESRGLVVSGTKRWTTLGSAVFQCALAGLVVMFHLAHPDILPIHLDPPTLIAPITKPPIPQVRMEAASASASPAMPSARVDPVAVLSRLFLHPTTIDPAADSDPVPTGLIAGTSMNDGAIGPMLASAASSSPNITVVPAAKIGPVKVSSGVSAGMLLSPIQPVYPAIARVARIEGAVVMEAMISKAGRIESLHVVSGPPILRTAAVDAVQAARYQPYKLNGEATEVQTMITVNFRLGS